MRRVAMIGVLLLSGGCTGGGSWGPVLEVSPPETVMGRYDVTVTRSATLETRDGEAIQIDVIALTNDQYCRQKWFSCPLQSYFGPRGHTLRDQSPTWKASLATPGDSSATLKAADALWDVWQAEGATHLVILAKRPGPGAAHSNDDARRLVLPLDRSRWLKDGIEVRLMPSGLVLRTRRLPPWPGQPVNQFKHY